MRYKPVNDESEAGENFGFYHNVVKFLQFCFNKDETTFLHIYIYIYILALKMALMKLVGKLS